MKKSERVQVLEFLKHYVIGKTVMASPITTHTDNDQLIVNYEEDVVFNNLVETTQGFLFDMIALTRGTRYLNGDKLLAEGTMNVVRVIRYEMTERLSSGNLVGHSCFVSSTSTQPDPFGGTIFLVRMCLKDGALEVDENQVGYADVVSAKGSYKPIATDGKYTYSIEESKLVVKYQQTRFDVDPKTLKRIPTNDKFPLQVSHEIIFPPELGN
jgi:hypothetical protein